MLRQRILTAAVVLLVALAALFWFPNAAWSLFIALVTMLGAWEWGRLSGWGTAARLTYAVLIGASCVAIFTVPTQQASAAWQAQFDLAVFAAALAFWIGIALPWIAWRWRLRNPIALALAGWWVLVPAWLAATRLQLQPVLLLSLLVIIWVADTAAYFAGRRFGRNKLAPLVSPGKTWEGVAGAMAAVAVYAWAMQPWVAQDFPSIAGARWMGLAFVLVGLGIVGDLFESWLKRRAQVKDSGRLLPGHGGILDRADALTAAMPLAALVVTWVHG